VDLWIDKCNIFFQLEAYSHALKSYEKAIFIEPKNSTAWKFKGITLYYLDRYTECQEALEQALYLSPKDDEIHIAVAEYYLIFGDIKSAYKHIEDALSVNEENAVSLYIKGKIKIEEQDYATSLRCFRKAISLDLRNPKYLLWDAYTKYLMAELEFGYDEKKYQDMVLAIIRELEKIGNCNSIEHYSNFKMFLSWFFKIIPRWFRNLVIDLANFMKEMTICANISEKQTVRFLEIVNSILTELESKQIIAYNYYFLGCFYYKVNDYYTAVEYLRKSNSITSDSTIKNSAREILNNVWNNKIRPSIWRWWLFSPLNPWVKRVTFAILVFSLFGILLPSQVSGLPIGSFFSTIDWKENSIPLTFVTLIILFILASPNVQNFKGSQIEIEIRPPPAFELTPSLIERNLNECDYMIKP
jgi:tetratricopeptide (TPR) repeat protein